MGEKQFKVVLLGEGRVGKTSLVLRYTKNSFDDKQQQTVQASYQQKRLNLDNHRVVLSIWDTAGQEKFHALGPIYYRDSQGALLVFDITDNDTFIRVQNWVKELRKMLGKDVALAIAGNKCDLERTRVVSEADAKSYAESVGASYFNTSAKLNKNVNEIFLDLSKRMLEQSIKEQDDPSTPIFQNSPGTTNTKKTLKFESADNTKPVEGGGCSC